MPEISFFPVRQTDGSLIHNISVVEKQTYRLAIHNCVKSLETATQLLHMLPNQKNVSRIEDMYPSHHHHVVSVGACCAQPIGVVDGQNTSSQKASQPNGKNSTAEGLLSNTM